MDNSSFVKEKITELLCIVEELEEKFPGRRFSLDGHLLGSIGEVLAAEYYGITLFPNNTKTHDGEVDGKKVQIKVTQGDSVDIMDVPEYLLVLFLNKSDKNIYEVYNGPCAWLENYEKSGNGWYTRSLTTLFKLNNGVSDNERLRPISDVRKWNPSIKNK